MGISLKPQHLKRYRDVARLLVRYGRSDLVRSAGLEAEFADEVHDGDDGKPDELARDLEAMGPTYIKLGQLLSTRADLLPPAYLDALGRLQDRVEPFGAEEAEALVEEELGARISKAFRRFDMEPLAAASLGQVHYGELRDGRPVAVKVQRPDIRKRIATDLEALDEIARLLDRHTRAGEQYDFRGIVAEFRQSLAEELDYRTEATNLKRLAGNLSRFDRLMIPEPVDDYTTSRVLTMDFVTGRKITALSPLARIEMDGPALADQLFEAYLQQILVDGFFHADPHPGNLFVTNDDRIALLDLGMVGRIPPRMQEKLLSLLLAVAEGQGERAAEVSVELGDRGPSFDEPAFTRATAELVAAHRELSVSQIELGRVVMSVSRVASEHGIRMPAHLTLLGKTLLNLDQVGRALDPDFDPDAAVQRHAARILRQRMLKQASPGNVFSTVLEMNEFVQRLPAQLNRFLDRASGNELEIRVNAFDEVHLMEGLQKIANRIAAGVVLAALIVGAAMLMQVDTDFQLLGYPGLAMILFIAAVIGGVILLVDVIQHDEKAR